MHLMEFLKGTKNDVLTSSTKKEPEMKWFEDMSFAANLGTKIHADNAMTTDKGSMMTKLR